MLEVFVSMAVGMLIGGVYTFKIMKRAFDKVEAEANEAYERAREIQKRTERIHKSMAKRVAQEASVRLTRAGHHPRFEIQPKGEGYIIPAIAKGTFH